VSKTLPETARQSQRLDKWLWHARITKTRTLATRLITSGKARVNRARVNKPSRSVSAGDAITLIIHGRVRVLKVLACGQRRGPAAEAHALYQDKSPAREQRESSPAPPLAPGHREQGAGRPTKRDRRRIERWLSEV